MSKGAAAFPIVGIGASAGGLEACTALFERLSTDTGMAFVIIVHLDPQRRSIMAQLIAKTTKMRVAEIRDGMLVEPNRVFVIPPGKAVALSGGRLRLSPRAAAGKNVIDFFFRSLAAQAGGRAIGLILSGTASDGVEGLEAVKAEGGLTIAQDEGSAKYPGMPHNAIASGAADVVLSPPRIAVKLAELARHPYIAASAAAALSGEASEAERLAKVFTRIRRATGIDFTYYKRTTILRRIARRMALAHVRALDEYVAFLDRRPDEAQALAQDLLIRVTGFFRDRDSFDFLRRNILPRLLKERDSNATLRIWVPGCATGEEAYSIAMCALDAVGRSLPQASVQVFATDVSEDAVQRARRGVYPESVAGALPKGYLRRFFVQASGGYQVSKAVRDACVFARQDVTRDPPFSKLDLISCRNLLIYVEPALQKRVLSIFHYALKTGGHLILGTSETAGATGQLFSQVDRKHRAYVKRIGAALPPLNLELNPLAAQDPPPASAPAGPDAAPREELFAHADRLLLAQFAPAAVVVDKDLQILQFRGDTSPFLSPPQGRASLNLLKMVHGGLLFETRALVAQARRRRATAEKAGVRIESRRGALDVVLRVVPLPGPRRADDYLLVVFEAAPAPAPAAGEPGVSRRTASDREIRRLRQELGATRDHLQPIIEQQEASNEELQSANEEVLSANEELQSTNEELESAKEELQSVNEELTTVNDELARRNGELGQLNDDLNNLISGLSMPVVILGGDLRIRRFTASAERALNLIPGDVGRPITDIKLGVAVPGFKELVEEVVESGSPQEVEGRDARGRWFSLRLRPYKTKDKRVDGAVLMFVDIETLKSSIEELRAARDYAEAIFETLRQPLLLLDAALRVRRANPAFYETFPATKEETEGRPLAAAAAGRWNIPRLRALLKDAAASDAVLRDVELDVGERNLVFNARRVVAAPREAPAVLLAVEDVTEKRRAQEADELRRRAAMQREFVANVSHELRTPVAAIMAFTETLLAGGVKEAKREKYLSIIERHARRLARQVEDILRLSALESGRRKPEPRRIDVRGFIDAFLEGIEPLAAAKSLTLSCEVEPGLAVLADKAHLHTVLQNLCENAIEHARRGERVRLSAKRAGGEALIVVRDGGRGIAPSDLARLFEGFSGRPKSKSGTGLGLPIARALVEANGGRISVASVLRKGTSVSFTLPLAQRR